MNSGLKRIMAFLLSMTLVSVSALNMFLGKYAKTFALTDSLSVTFESASTVNLPPGAR